MREWQWLEELVSLAAHRLAEPLAAISINTSTIERQLRLSATLDDDMADLLASILADTRRAASALSDLHAVATLQSDNAGVLHVHELLASVKQCVRELNALKTLEIIVLPLAAVPPLRGNRFQISYAIAHLVLAAAGSMAATSIMLSAAHSANQIQIWIMNAENWIDAAKITEPVSLKAPAAITSGLGLCWSLLRAHGGELEIRRAPNGHEGFVLYLPAAGEYAVPAG